MTVSTTSAGLTREEKARLFDRLRKKRSRVPGSEDRIPRRPPGLDPIPLSFAQERLWFLNRLEPENPNNMPTTLVVRGELSVGCLEAAFREVIRRHETLRTTFSEVEGRPAQEIAPPGDWSLLRVDLEGVFAASQELGEAEIRHLAVGGFWRPYDLERGPLLRGALVRRSAVEHLLLLDMHHIVSDGWSMGVLVSEVSVLYAAALYGRPSPLPDLPVQYADFALWQRAWLSGETLESLLAWWRERLAGHSGVLHLPTDRPRPPAQSFRGGQEPLNLGPELAAGVAALATRHGVTLFMAMLAAFNALLQRYTSDDDILVSTPVANRNRVELTGLIGFFVNTLVLRTRLGDDPSFSDLLARSREDAVGAYAHQDLPFERLVQELAPERDLSRNPLFQVQFILQNTPVQRLELVPGLTLAPAEMPAGSARFDLVLSFQEYEGDVVGGAEFAADLFDAATIRRLLRHFHVLLAGAVAAPETRLSELPLLTPEESVQIAGWGEGRRLEPARGLQIHRLFQEQVRRAPEAVALIAPWTAEHLTYAALAAGAERLARRLRAFGVGPGMPVALFLERSVPLVTAMLAVLETGGYYVPLETEHPLDRLAWMLEDSGCLLVLTTSDLEERLPARGAHVVLVDLPEDPAAAGEDSPEAGLGGEALAYLLYTSGSTGRPKGVLVQHGAVVSHLRWYEERFPLSPGDRFLQRTPVGFDPSVTEIWAPLLAGSALVLAEPGRHGDMAYLAAVCAEQEITLMKGVPSLYRMLFAEPGLAACRSLRRMWTGGEILGPDVLERFFAGPLAAAGAELINVYGPTETTVEVTAWRCEPERADRPAPLGGPIAGTRLRVLGPRGTVCPAGVPGEMYIGGRSVGLGYQGRPAETAARFVPDPWGEPGGRMYRTGDLVRWLPAGDLEFLGRTDQQVKIRGVRIELEEIESVLQGCPLVREMAVAVVGEGQNQRLAAYLVPAGSNVEAREVRAWLRGMLPELMMPSAFVFLPALPQTAHGKLDRKALPDPEAARDPAAFTAPRTPVEEALAEIWKEVLGVERVGARDEFFDLGGHSLLATQVVSRLRDRLGVEVQVRALFETPVLADFARSLEQQGASVASGPIPRRPASLGPPPLSFAQERLWFLDRLDAGTAYNIPLALRISGDLSVAALEGAFRELVRRHEALRTTFAEVGDQAVQVIAPPGGWSMLRIDLSGLFAVSPELGEAEVLRLAMTGVWRPFDLRRGPLLRAVLVEGGGDHLLFLDMHHIVSDGWSMGVLVREIAALYTAAAEGRFSPLPELPIQYADFAVWQRGWLTGEVLEAQLGYWREQLAGAPSLELPTDRPRPVTQSFRGARVRFDIEPGQAQPLTALSRSRDASLFMTLLAACQILLGRQTGQEDVVTGSAIANRNRAELEPLIGFFVNSLVLRGDLSGDPTFLDMLDRARRATLDAYSHQDLPFERLVEELNPERKLSHNPLFQVMFALQNMPWGRVDLPGITLAPVEFDFPTTRFDLEIYFWEAGGALAVDLIYATDLFDEPTFQRFAAHLRTLVAEVVADPGRPLSALNLLSESERLQLQEWNDTRAELPAASLVDLFEEQVAVRPGEVAVSSDEGDLTYADLDRRAARLARRLAGLGVGPEVPVALLAERSPAMIVGLLAILKAGGAYLPLDPAYPAERLAWMREDAGASILLAQPDLLAGLPERAREGVAVELTADPADPEDHEGADPVRPAFDGLAYVMYTSGSTGRPKAVAVTHRNVVRLVRPMRPMRKTGFADLGPEQVFLQLAPISFDASTLEIWAALANGGRLAVFPSYRPSLEEIGDAVSRWGVTTLWLTAGLFHQMVEGPIERLKPLRQLLAGGDVLSPEHVRRALAALPGCTVINGYGPTEGTTFTCCYPMTDPAQVGSTVPIGAPIGNTRVHVVDTHLRPVPVGVYGELYAGGDGLSRGYLGRPELTAERFVPDPFAVEPGSRLYRTGDVVRLRGDGLIEFQGRRDGQVKLRGYRIELGEVESVLARHPEVRDAAVVIQEAADGDKRLVACVVPRPAEAAEEASSDAAEHVAQWQDLYEETYGEGAAPEEDPTFNIQGWNSSYTGEPIPAEEMREWREGTVARLQALPHRRVLEVGCGTGLLLLRVAPESERYRGTDFSAVALDYVRRQVTRPGHELPQVELAQGLADDWSGVGPGDFDLVVLNSVVQYFPGIDYLVRVLEGAVRAVSPGGAVFVGDVRSLPLLEALHTSVELYQSRGAASVAELRRR
ncbi:MAG TPA: amino acid adenylation domain-containing protein, partial [Thermoanaerobaculia bacterium]|nr:amino acid adenylation domain-containing protein [Thermoanaerobaculia bacterium]